MMDMSPTETNELHVRIGQVKIGRPGDTLTAILGSCIGIGFLWEKAQIYGLAHCLLSKSPNGPVNKNRGGRHVDQAIASLMSMMEVEEEDRRNLRIVLAGGANMSKPLGTAPEKLVGSINARFARQAIRSAGLRLLDHDLEGINGRRIQIDCASGEYSIQHIPRMGGIKT